MKCPKCGSENLIVEKSINGFSTCQDCGYRWQHEMKQPELSTAEKLLWLGNNCARVTITRCIGEFFLIEIFIRNECYNDSDNELSEAVKQAYDWAIKEEVTE